MDLIPIKNVCVQLRTLSTFSGKTLSWPHSLTKTKKNYAVKAFLKTYSKKKLR